MKRLFSIITLLFLAALPNLVFAADIFNPSAIANRTDLSIQYLQDIFGVVGSYLHGTGSQIMGQMFAVFNAGALALGGIIVAYTLLIGTLNTAHEGEVLGRRWSSIWIPVRSAAGVALLLPNATGYSIIQLFMMSVIVQGIGLADSVWNAALGYLQNGGVIVASNVQGQTNQSSIITQNANILRMMVCVQGVQQALNTAYQNLPKTVGNFNTTLPQPPNLIETIVPIVGVPFNNTIYFPGDPSINNPQYSIYAPLKGICGQVVLPSTPSPSKNDTITPDQQSQIQQDQIVATQQLILDMEAPAAIIVQQLLHFDGPTPPPPSGNILPQATFYDATQDYIGLVAPIERMLSATLPSKVQAAISSAESQGWIMAGAYYSTLAQLNASTESNIQAQVGPPTATSESTLVTTLGANGGNLAQKMPFGSQYAGDIANMFTNGVLDQYITTAVNWALNQYKIPPPTFSIDSATAGLNFPRVTAPHYHGHGLAGDIAAAIANLLAIPIAAVITALGDVVQKEISYLDITSVINQLANAQSTHANPIILIATLGAHLMNAVIALITQAAIGFGMASIAGILIPGLPAIILPVIIILWSFLFPIVMALFVNGLVMFYYVPMIPFIIFIFAALGWMINVIEAMVGAPLLALGFTHPEGEGIFSRYVEPGLGLIASVFLTPSMMIIGFIAAYSLSYVGIWVLNQGLFGAGFSMFSYIQQQANPTSITLVFGLPLFLIIYVSLVITILNQAFSLIHVIPDKVIRWLGVTGQTIGDSVQKGLDAARGGVEAGGKTGEQAAGAAASTAVTMAKSALAGASGTPTPPAEKSSSSGESSSPAATPPGGTDTGSGGVTVS